MSPGSEPERDDTGLPPVDIEIPDDARELDRDVQAYHREQRARRRQLRRNRWHRSLGKDGIVLPLLACCLILALIAGTLLTVFTATSEQGQTGPGLSGSGANSAQSTGQGGQSEPHIVAAGLLPEAVITVSGGAAIPLDQLRQAMLVLVPPGCDCGSTLAWLADVALSAQARAYVIYNQQTQAEVQQLYGQLNSRSRAMLTLADDSSHVLTSAARGISATQLTAVLVAPDRTVHYATGLSPSESKTELVNEIIF